MYPGFINKCARIDPDSITKIPVELGKKFTAVCILEENSTFSAEDISWHFANFTVPRESYTRINQSAVAVTVTVSSYMRDPLMCKATKLALSYEDPCTYGIYLDKGCKYFFLFL